MLLVLLDRRVFTVMSEAVAAADVSTARTDVASTGSIDASDEDLEAAWSTGYEDDCSGARTRKTDDGLVEEDIVIR